MQGCDAIYFSRNRFPVLFTLAHPVFLMADSLHLIDNCVGVGLQLTIMGRLNVIVECGRQRGLSWAEGLALSVVWGSAFGS